jgi:hypothetical protein
VRFSILDEPFGLIGVGRAGGRSRAMTFPLLRANSTLDWLMRAAANPIARHATHLPDTLDFSEHAALFLNTYHAAPAGIELGFPIVLDGERLAFPVELTAQARYAPFIGSGRFIGTFHVHPAAPDGSSAPFFDPQDLANSLRSDNAGFVDLLLAGDRLLVLVRSNPYVYISAHHVNRNPLLLQEQHTQMRRRGGSFEPSHPYYAEHYRKAGLYWFHRYQLALYEGDPQQPLQRIFTPEGRW